MLQSLEIPHDDAIGPALSELDAKLSAWLSAMADAQERLQQYAARVSEVRGAEVAPPDAPHTLATPPASPVADDAATTSDTVEPPREESIARNREELPTVAEERSVDDAPPGHKPTSTARPAAVPGERKASKGIVALQQAEPPAPPEPAGPEPKTSADDEALLATLDERTVSALRVMRRLSPVKKSMRELLAEYEAQQGTQEGDATPAKASWWRRK